MLLGIGLHAAMSFFPGFWWVEDRTAGWGSLYDEFLWAVHGFRMPVFFLMSGFFTAMLWRRRGLKALLSHRLRRVALPLAVGLLTLVPLTNWIGGRAVSSGAQAAEQGGIFEAVFAGDAERVAELLDGGYDSDMRGDPDGWTLLHAAAFTGDSEMVELLLSRGADPALTSPASEGRTPLEVAFHFGHEKAADLLVSYGGGDGPEEGKEWSDYPGWAAGAEGGGEDEGAGFDPAEESSEGGVFEAVFAGDVERVAELLDGGYDPDMRNDPGGWTLLHAAAFTGDPEMVELLLSRGADTAPTAPASEGETPLGVAFYFGQEKAADLLVSYGGGDGPEEDKEWSDYPGWAAGAEAGGGEGEGGEDGGSALDLAEAVNSFHHLWFLYFLLWLAAGFAAVAWAVDRWGGGRPGGSAWPRLVMWSMIPLTLLPQLAMGVGGAFPVFGPDTYDGFLPPAEAPHLLAYYAAFFTFGALLYGRPAPGGGLASDRIGRFWPFTLPLSLLIAFPIGLAFTFDPEMFSWPAASVLQVLYAWGMCLGLMGLFRALLGRERRGVRYLSDSSYWLYLAHLPLVVAAQLWVRDWAIPSGVKFLGISAGVTLLLLACYQLFIRYTPVGAALNGKKTRPPRRPARPAPDLPDLDARAKA